MVVPTLSRYLLQGYARWKRYTLSHNESRKPCDLDGEEVTPLRGLLQACHHCLRVSPFTGVRIDAYILAATPQACEPQ